MGDLLSQIASFPGQTSATHLKGATPKVDDALVDLWERYGVHQLALGDRGSFQPHNSLLQIDQDRVLVDIAAAVAPGSTADQADRLDTTALITALAHHGFVVQADYGALVSGYLPIEALTDIAASDAIQFIRPTYGPMVRQGIARNQATVALRADIAQTEFGVTGAGVTVGVLSDSFNNLGGAASDRLTGDLPQVNVLQDLPGGGSDEGRAMLQLIADIAPGANLAFHTAFLGAAGFAQGILALAQAGADIIVDDVIYLTEPFFQDGIVAQAVDQVVAQGVAYFSAAGNNGDTAYESAFRNSGIVLNLRDLPIEAHDFDPGEETDIFQTITIGAGAEINLSFQWASPYFSASGIRGATSDLDIFLLNDRNQVVASSLDNNLDGDPVEVLNFTNLGAFATDYNLVIGKFAGDTPSLIKYVGFGDLSISEFDTGSGTIFGQANAQGAQAVGAAFFEESPAFGAATPRVEDFSTVGGTPILFDSEGNRLAEPNVRQKPDIVAPDGGNTTFFGRDIALDTDQFPNFFGTSAAAPNAAAVAALLLEAVPDASPTEIYQALQTSALDLDNPYTEGFDVGFDAASGYGLIQADGALQALLNSRMPGPITTPIMGTDQADNLVGTAAPDMIEGLAGADQILGAAGNDTIDAGTGNDIVNGGLGDDLILGNGGDDILWGDDNDAAEGGCDRIFGGPGNDLIGGKAGDDQLFGDEGNDIIWGGLGNDILWGGLGNDILTGNNGTPGLSSQDTFILSAGSGTDTITDFDLDTDLIGLSGISLNDLTFTSNTIQLGTETLAILTGITNTAAIGFVIV
ncbi:S8 family serine peptidase [Leptothoe sp. PORK10 BA2]|uniref:S8 family serine peptidase n=1 Tax=Leptothoe sp. PORK10 BA2 TaxID=3110254 RepID=UPI002B1F3E24|nr:S8 family serine peptidase [Leptothoe sp. PORK10 BA2]MEA5464335.1 S8 family serine peptidase [Leptothoe sp. PORK10 BA2]